MRVVLAAGILATGLFLVSACQSDEDPASDGGGGSGGNRDSPGDTFSIENEEADRSHISYVANLLAKEEAGEWTRGEGLVATLGLFAGERDKVTVLRHPEVRIHEATGIFEIAHEYVEDGPDAAARAEVSRLLDLLIFSIEELEEMAGSPQGAAAASGLVAKSSVENCLKFFKGFELPAGVGVCLEEEATMVNGKRYRIFSPGPSFPSAGWTEGHRALALEAIQESVAELDKWGQTPPAAVVFSVVDGSGEGVEDDAVLASAALALDEDCGIVLYTAMQAETPGAFQQVVAHELAHCFQAKTFPGQNQVLYHFRAWREEGLAEYLSNVVYPFENLEWTLMDDLEAVELNTTLFDRDYENFLFFQYLGNAVGNVGVMEVVRALPTGGDSLEQEQGLASYPNMDEHFHDFVRQTTDRAIRDTSGETIPFTPRAVPIHISSERSPRVEAPQALPFKTYRVLLSVDFSKQATLELQPSGTIIEGARQSAGPAFLDESRLAVESLMLSSGRPWDRQVPNKLPEEECDTNSAMVVATTTEPVGAFALNVLELEILECCLHGKWLANNDDFAEANSEAWGIPVSVSGQLTAEYAIDGLVTFTWSGHSFQFEGEIGGEKVPITSTINGSGTQFYSVASEIYLMYEGPELTVTVTDTVPGRDVPPVMNVLDTALGDGATSQLFECEGDTLITNNFGRDYEWKGTN